MATQLEKEITRVHRECFAKGSAAALWKVTPEGMVQVTRADIYLPDYWPSYQAIRKIEARLAKCST